MKQITALVLSASLTAFTAAPAVAQTNDETEEGFDLMEEGAKMLLRGLMTEMEPAIRELEGIAQDIGPAMQLLADEMGPAIAEIMSKIDDIRNYEAPEILPNGDIIIRRSPDAPVFDPDRQIDL